jgi:hypothetical protein
MTQTGVRHEAFVTVVVPEGRIAKQAREAGGGVDGRARVLYGVMGEIEARLLGPLGCRVLAARSDLSSSLSQIRVADVNRVSVVITPSSRRACSCTATSNLALASASVLPQRVTGRSTPSMSRTLVRARTRPDLA